MAYAVGAKESMQGTGVWSGVKMSRTAAKKPTVGKPQQRGNDPKKRFGTPGKGKK